MDEVREKAEKAVEKLKALTEEISLIEAIIAQEHPDMWERYLECKTDLDKVSTEAKAAIRLMSPGVHTLAGHPIELRSPPMKLAVDLIGLMDRAESRGEMEDLLEAGVLTYQVIPHQIGRLNGTLRAIYNTYLTQEPGTAAVVLPAALRQR
jgi:hypothetical protein